MTAPHPEAALSAQKIDHAVEAFRKASLEAIQSLRHRAAATFTPSHMGNEGQARCDSFYEAYEAVRTLPTPPSTAHTATAGDGGLTLTALHEANIARQAEWCPDQVPDLSFRGNELAGETGEACNVIKKLERERQGWRGSRATLNDLAEELADVVICADLCAVTAGIDLSAAVVAKFNATSDKVGISVRLPLAQAPAVQAPAGEALREATEILISALDECGEIFGTIRDDYTDPRRECREGRERAAEALKAARALLAASPTPTDAQPKAARPVGDEALREAFRNADVEDWQRLDDLLGYSGHGRFWRAVFAKVLDALKVSALASHPTTGQETVATPRDDGVREASPADRLRMACDFLEGLSENSAPGKRHALNPIVVGSMARVALAAIRAALSAPGSAGPGAEEKIARMFASVRGHHDLDYGILTTSGVTKPVWTFYRENARQVLDLLATPSPAQEPGTGDTGVRCGYRFVSDTGGDHTVKCRTCGQTYEFAKDEQPPCGLSPATTAETRGPADREGGR